MAHKFFDCDECGAHGKIIFKVQNDVGIGDVAFCPMCGADIFDYDDDEDFDYEENGLY